MGNRILAMRRTTGMASCVQGSRCIRDVFVGENDAGDGVKVSETENIATLSDVRGEAVFFPEFCVPNKYGCGVLASSCSSGKPFFWPGTLVISMC